MRHTSKRRQIKTAIIATLDAYRDARQQPTEDDSPSPRADFLRASIELHSARNRK